VPHGTGILVFTVLQPLFLREDPNDVSVKIRLMRVGKRKQPTYRVVVADSRSPRDGRIIETIGHYGPRNEPSKIDIDDDRALDWLRKGAQPSESVQKLLTISGVWATFEAEKGGPIVTKLNRRGFSTGRGVTTKTKKKPMPEAPVVEAPASEAPPAEAPASEAPAAEADAPEDATVDEVSE
jgi:small subunit ribosomal protein S16